MPLRPGVIPPKDMNVREYARWCAEQDTTNPGDIQSALAAHTASNDNTTLAELVAAILTHTQSTDNTTLVELNDAIAVHTASADNVTDAQLTATIASLNLQSGTYVPTLSNITNLDGSTAFECQMMRLGTIVHVSGRLSANPTAAGAVQLGISLPVASNFGALEDCAGTGYAPAISEGAAIVGDAANNRAEMQWIAVDTTDQVRYFHFMYAVI